MDLKNKFCPKPFEYLDIHYVDGEFRTYTCCPTWLGVDLGSLEKASFQDIWNGPKAIEIRKSILNESFLYCSKELCPEIQSGTLHDKRYIYKRTYQQYLKLSEGRVSHGPRILYFSEDRSCNLSCPSCRTDYISISKESVEHILKVRNGHMDELIKDVESLNICSSGDPFSSKIYRPFLFELQGKNYPKLRINLNTNGVLLTPEVFEKMSMIHSNLDSIIISLDAARLETYNVVRRGGDWSKLLKNIEYLSQQRRKGKFDHLQLDFVVQDSNYREMPEFVKLGQKLRVDKVYFQRISNWGTFSKVEFLEKDIINDKHPLHQNFLNTASHPLLAHQIVKKGNLSRFMPVSKVDKCILMLKKVPGIRALRKWILQKTT
jgi:sulfatase maturation enzyme AslB (radical SAM superfamily)